MRELSIAEYLARLADRVPAPGGGAVAALHAAQAAALLGMVARYTDGPRYAADRELVDRVKAEADTRPRTAAWPATWTRRSASGPVR